MYVAVEEELGVVAGHPKEKAVGPDVKLPTQHWLQLR